MKGVVRRWVLGLLMASQVLAWSFNYIAGKVALAHLDPWTLVSFRLVLAGMLYLAIFLVAPRPVRFARSDLPMFVLLAICGVVINQGCFTLALNYTSIGHVALIIAVGPVLVLVLARLARQETLTPAKVAGMALAFSGVALLAIRQGFDSGAGGLIGDLLAIGGASGFACFTVLSKRVANRYDPIGFNACIHMIGAVFLIPLAVHQAHRLDWAGVAWAGWAGLAYMVVFSSVVGFLVFYKLLGYISASRVASLNYLLPIVATSLGFVLLGERIDRSFLVAAALVLIGVWLALGSRWQGAPAD